MSATVLSLLLILILSCGMFTAGYTYTDAAGDGGENATADGGNKSAADNDNIATADVDEVVVTGNKAEITACGDENAAAPEITAKACILYSEDLDRVMYSKNADAKFAPYSITKLVTATIAAEMLDMNETVTISKKAADDMVGGSTMYLVEGERVTIEELMYGTLLLSGNDAAYALAEACCGSEAGFVRKMNETVEAWGCTDTHFVNPSGIDDDNHYTTANDLLIIAKHAFANKTVHRIATTRKYTMAATNKYPKRVMKNHTTLIKNPDSGVLGGKTGFWSETDCTAAIEYNKDELSAILIILKDTEKGRVKDAKAMLKYAHEVTPGYCVGNAGDRVKRLWVWRGKQLLVDAVLAEDVYAYPEDGEETSIKTEFVKAGKLEAPICKGDKVGTFAVRVDGKLVATVDAVAGSAVAARFTLH